MKLLKKIILISLLLGMPPGSFAQTFGLKAGLNLTNMLWIFNDEDWSDDFYKMKTGFRFGTTVEFPVYNIVSLETGLLLSNKGYRHSEEAIWIADPYDESLHYLEIVESRGKFDLYYLDIPLSVKVSFDEGDVKIYGTFGPYIGIGLNGTNKFEVNRHGETETREIVIRWGSGNYDHFKRIDYGLLVGAGVEINSVRIGLSYAMGLENISPPAYFDYKYTNRVSGISVGYKFGGK